MPRVEWNHERAERPFVWAYRMKYYCVSVWACVVRSGIVTRGSMYDMWGREREASNRCHNNFQRMSWLRILLKTFNNGLECGTSSFSFSSSAFRVRLRLPYASLYTVFNSQSSGVQNKKEPTTKDKYYCVVNVWRTHFSSDERGILVENWHWLRQTKLKEPIFVRSRSQCYKNTNKLLRLRSSGWWSHGYVQWFCCEQSAASQDGSGTLFKLLLKSQYQAKFCLLMPAFVSQSNSNSWLF